ncbi:hypothetical protein D9R19_05525 [Corynebacterium diphtheriae]|nr:hypothetical protein D9R19_05525 [Corynebacterium diphtheriae]
MAGGFVDAVGFASCGFWFVPVAGGSEFCGEGAGDFGSGFWGDDAFAAGVWFAWFFDHGGLLVLDIKKPPACWGGFVYFYWA